MVDDGFKNVITAFSNQFAALHKIYHITSHALIVTLARNRSSYKITTESHQSAFFLHLREHARIDVKARKYSLREQSCRPYKVCFKSTYRCHYTGR